MRIKIIIFVVAITALCWLAVTHAQEHKTSERLTPAEIENLKPIKPGAGTSGLAGIMTRVLKGDPNQPGLYTIQLTVPAHTRIAAHTHRDDRVATVISGTWSIGYGKSFDEQQLKSLPPGSFYTEPAGIEHFAQTQDQPVTVQITGYGPTDTNYVESKENK